MVNESIVLGHKISKKLLEVHKAKIERFAHTTSMKGARSFLGHVGFYRWFIKYFSQIWKPLCKYLQHDIAIEFDVECVKAFDTLKQAFMTTPVINTPDWEKPFEAMCDASDYDKRVMLC